MSGTYPPGWGSGSGDHGAAADAARAKATASAKKKEPAPGQPDQPGEAEAKLRAAGVSEADIARGYSSGGSGGSSRPGQPDQPGEAEAKMIQAGAMKQIVGYYKDPQTGTFKFAAKGEPLPRVPVPPPAETKQMQQAAALRAAQQPPQTLGLIPQFDERTTRPEFTSGTAYQYDQPYLRDPTIIDLSLRHLKEADVAVSKRLPLQPDPFTTYTQFWSDIGKPIRERYDTGKMPVAVKGGMEFVRGASRGVYESPVTTIATAGVFVIAAPAIAGTTTLASGLPVVGTYAVPVARTALAGMGLLYAHGVHRRITAPEETIIQTRHEGIPSLTGEPGQLITEERVFRERTFPEKMRIAGRILGTEVIPMAAGARLATHPPPVPKVRYDPSAGIAAVRVGKQFDIAVGKGYTTYVGGKPTYHTASARLELFGRSKAIGGEIAKPPIDWAQTSYRGLKLESTPEVVALKARMQRQAMEVSGPPRLHTFDRVPVHKPSVERPPDVDLMMGGRFGGARVPTHIRPIEVPRTDLLFGGTRPTRPLSQYVPPRTTRIASQEVALKAKRIVDTRAAKAKWLAEDIASRPARRRAAAEAHARRVEAQIIAKRGEVIDPVPVVPLLTSGKQFRMTKKGAARGLMQSEAAQVMAPDLLTAPRHIAHAVRHAQSVRRARPAPPRQRVGGRQKLSPAMMQLMQTSQVQRISQVQAQYQPPAMSQAYKQLSAQEITQAQAQDQQQIVLPIFGQAQAQRTAQTQKQFQTQRLKTQMQTPVRHKMPPVTPRTGKTEVPPEPKPKPKPFALPTLKDTKAKRRIPRKTAAEAEHWQIRNPIASIQQMIAGRLQQLRLPK